MPRRNNRPVYEPQDFTTDLPDSPRPRPRIGDQWTPSSETQDQARREREAERKRLQERARLNGGIDWSVCLVPGCGGILPNELFHSQPARRDHQTFLPMCFTHLAVAYAQARAKDDETLMVEAVAIVLERREAKVKSIDEARKKAWLTKRDGHIYYVRINGLIKVGWSRDVKERIHSYGPDVEVLVVYPATFADETNLHRQLKPARARGKEWYEDGPILADFITKALEQHGPPRQFDSWSKPKQVVAGKRVKRTA